MINNLTLAARQRYNLRLLTGLFLFTTFSGAVRKWVLTDSLTNNLLLGVQIGLPVGFALLVRTRPLSQPIRFVLTAFSLILVVMAFNPLGQSVYHGIIGFFLHTGVFIPLLIYYNDRDAFPLETLTNLFLLVALVELVLGVVQFGAPADAWINRYARAELGIATAAGTGRVRIAGTFSYIGGLTALFAFYGFVVWGMRLLRQPAPKVLLLIGICAVVTPMTGARGLAVTLAVFGLFSTLANARDLRSSVAMLLIGSLSWGIYQNSRLAVVDDAFLGLTQRFQAGDANNAARITEPFAEIFDFRGNYPLFGTGLGGTYQGIRAIFGESPYVTEYGYYEEEPERVMLEGGYLLLGLRLGLWLLIVRLSRIPLWVGLPLVYLFAFATNTVFNLFASFYTFLGFMYLDRCYWVRQTTPKP